MPTIHQPNFRKRKDNIQINDLSRFIVIGIRYTNTFSCPCTCGIGTTENPTTINYKTYKLLRSQICGSNESDFKRVRFGCTKPKSPSNSSGWILNIRSITYRRIL
ncbi:hypothetical protein CEXT_722951 [Caerostris extrusa]|uniref:Uncharacterized protein n=1 Tax=Caerostris extrusa TaxID=172846 RepID=A0AAV4XYA7_CAEEX|nr:hypothetical protein CEXT_722951 [Caerostris extrusa]